MGRIRNISVIALSLGLVIGTSGCSAYETLTRSGPDPVASQVPYKPIPYPTTSSEPTKKTTASPKNADPKFIESSIDKLPLDNEKVFTSDGFLVTTANDTRFTLKSYGQTKTNSEGLLPAEGEVFHAFQFYYDSPSVYNIDEPIVTFIIDGITYNPELKWMEVGQTLVVSAPEDAEIAINIQTEEIKQSMNLKTGERISKGIADIWYGPYEGLPSPKSVSEAVGKYGHVDMTLVWAAKTLYDEEAGWSDGGKKTWVLAQLDTTKMTAKGYSLKDEINNAWLTDENGNKYELAYSRDIFDGTRLLFLVPPDVHVLTLHTSHGGKVMNGQQIVEEIPETEVESFTIGFPTTE